MTKIPDIYEKIGAVLYEMRSNPTTKSSFTTEDVYELYTMQYPEDEEYPGHSLRQYVGGMVYEYAKKTDTHNPKQPAIKFLNENLNKKTYCFLEGT